MYGAMFPRQRFGRIGVMMTVDSLPLFGTDGIRCLVGHFPLQDHVMPFIGYGVGQWIIKNQDGINPCVIMGQDTRQSSPSIAQALCQGLHGAGVQVWDAGVVPTPALSFFARHFRCFAFMVSASHNPFIYNGVKFFNSLGQKLSLDQEQALSDCIHDAIARRPALKGKGMCDRIISSAPYEDFVCDTVVSLRGIKVVLDAANGALYAIAARLFERCGATIIARFGMQPDGRNINDQCGSLHPGSVQKSVQDTGADLGVLFDGDGDRVIIVDRHGAVHDGDQIVACLASFQSDEKGIVGTVTSNMGLELFINRTKGAGRFVRAPVGDRWIADALRTYGWTIGGESCGHVLTTDLLPTGDGVLVGLHIAKTVAHNGDVFPLFDAVPCVAHNVHVADTTIVQQATIQEWYRTTQKTVTTQGGRCVMRPSGTEPVIRFFVEMPDQRHAQSVMDDVINQFNALCHE
jgi:phosphoglucosamine mutase